MLHSQLNTPAGGMVNSQAILSQFRVDRNGENFDREIRCETAGGGLRQHRGPRPFGSRISPTSPDLSVSSPYPQSTFAWYVSHLIPDTHIRHRYTHKVTTLCCEAKWTWSSDRYCTPCCHLLTYAGRVLWPSTWTTVRTVKVCFPQ